MKAYIAGAISSDPNYKDKFNRAEVVLKARGYKVMNPAILPEGFEWDEYMKITIAMLSVCDVVYVLPDWASSKGTQVEIGYATKHGIKVVYAKEGTL